MWVSIAARVCPRLQAALGAWRGLRWKRIEGVECPGHRRSSAEEHFRWTKNGKSRHEGLWIDPPGAVGAVEGGRGLFWGL